MVFTAIIIVLIAVGVFLIIKAFTLEGSSSRVSIVKQFESRQSSVKIGLWPMFNTLGVFNAGWLILVPKVKEFYRKKLIQADIDLEVPGLMFMKELLLVVGFVLFSQILTVSLQYAVIGMIVFFFLPDFYVKSKISKRQFLILRTFPEIVDLLSLCLSAGLDFTAALKWVTEGRFMIVNPFVDELRKIKEEIVLGKSRSQALKDMDQRLRIPEISSLVRTIIIAENMGVSVSESMDRFSVDARERRFHRGERQARISSIKILFPLIFLILPIVGIIIMGPIVLQFSESGFSMGL